MNNRRLLTRVAVAAAWLVPHSTPAGNYADLVLGYAPGTGATPGYDQAASALGEPSRVTPGEFGGPVDPFSAPWQSGQLVSLGTGGSLTVRFAEPVPNAPANPYGLDFQIFGSAAFLIVNGDFSGGGVTDGSLFGANAGTTRVSVSADGIAFYPLDPALAPRVDGLFPTDGAGDFSRPVNPALGGAAFADRDLTGIRALYAGSGGGVGYDIAWARDAGGQPVALDQIQFVRVDVVSDRAEIDGFAAVPEPGTVVLLGVGGLLLAVRQLRARAATR